MRFGSTILLAALALILGACRTFVFPPVEVTTEAISPTYRLTIENRLAGNLTVVPTEESSAPKVVRGPGESADFTLVIRRLKVGGSEVPQVIKSDFTETEAAGIGRVRLRADEADCAGCLSCDLLIDVRHQSWFAEQTRTENTPPEAKVCVAECFDGRVVFRLGPEADEC